MKASRIVFFAVLLFIFKQMAGVILTLMSGLDVSSGKILFYYATTMAISVCVFGYMSFAYPIKPYLTAFLVGLLAMLFGVLGSSLLLGFLHLNPIFLALDVLAVLVAALLGGSLGAKLRQRGAANP